MYRNKRKGKSNANQFNSIEVTKPNSNVFDLSHDVKLSCNMGELIPTLAMEVVPGDKINLGCNSLLRFAPMLAPIMHRVDVSHHFFFVPNRIVWDGWEDFISNGGGANGEPPVTPPAFPTLGFAGDSNMARLGDYLGLPVPDGGSAVNTETVSAIPFAAYQKIYNEYFRDENLVEPAIDELVDGDNVANILSLTQLRQRAWEHDYFTAALPFAQKGAPVSLPLGNVTATGIVQPDGTALNPANPPQFGTALGVGGVGALSGTLTDGINSPSTGTTPLMYYPKGTLNVTTTGTVGATTINDLRRAFRLQEWLEKSARGGSRYIELILIHFGVKSSDSRLQRPEYITGSKSPVVISEVLNTTGTEELPQGNMSGHGAAVTSGKYGNYFCEEHGYIIGIMSVMPKPAYQQGIPKHFLKIDDPFQYYWPEFAHIGEQEVLNKEIMAWPAGGGGGDTFGYVPRYAEYRYLPSRVCGDFRTSLSFWHLGRIFETPPTLSQEFIECDNEQTKRIFAVPGTVEAPIQHLWCHVLHNITARRLMPKYGTPALY